ncbi:hypothetical protein Tco_0458915 [Tanacetum coccineum]
MDNLDITMEEYIQLMADNAQRRKETFNWEIAIYGKVYCEEFDSFADFDTDFPAIVYNDASTSNQNVSSVYSSPQLNSSFVWASFVNGFAILKKFSMNLQ